MIQYLFHKSNLVILAVSKGFEKIAKLWALSNFYIGDGNYALSTKRILYLLGVFALQHSYM